MTPGPRAATRRLHDYLKIDDSPRDSVELLTSIVEAEKWIGNAGDARERAETWDEKFRAYLRDDLSELNRLGRHCFFAFNSSSETMLQGAAFIEANDSASLKSEKTRRQLFRTYIEALRQLTARQLELVCAGMLSLVGAKFPTVTRYSADRGVDFFGQLPLAAFFLADQTFPGWQTQMDAWMVGQAKHYVDGTVSTPALRDLIGSVSMLRSPKADRRAYPNLIIRTCDSVFHLLVTTGRLSSEVWREIDNHGAIGIDGEMLAAFLATHGVASSNIGFDGSKFIEWLSNFETFPIVEAHDDDAAMNDEAPKN